MKKRETRLFSYPELKENIQREDRLLSARVEKNAKCIGRSLPMNGFRRGCGSPCTGPGGYAQP